MVTDEVSDQNIFENNFSVARVNHDFNNSRSSLGMIYVGKNEIGNSNNEYNKVYALDGKLALGKKADIRGFRELKSTSFEKRKNAAKRQSS